MSGQLQLETLSAFRVCSALKGASTEAAIKFVEFKSLGQTIEMYLRFLHDNQTVSQNAQLIFAPPPGGGLSYKNDEGARRTF